jgi:DNA-directed RNA polymerase beta' subunit
MSKLIKIVMLTAVLAAMMTVPCMAEDVAAEAERVGLSGAVSEVLRWVVDNPAAVFSTIISGVTGGFCLGGGVSNRKTRKDIEGKSKGLTTAATTINNNAAELAGKVKTEVVNMIASVDKSVGKILTALSEKADEIIAAIKENAAETRALRREIQGNSFLIREMFKDARMTQLRKDYVEKGYNDIVRGGETANDEQDQA